jgi:L-serine deaminase
MPIQITSQVAANPAADDRATRGLAVTVAIVAGLAGYVLRSVFSRERMYREHLDACRRSLTRAGDVLARREAVSVAVKRIHRANRKQKYRRDLH